MEQKRRLDPWTKEVDQKLLSHRYVHEIVYWRGGGDVMTVLKRGGCYDCWAVLRKRRIWKKIGFRYKILLPSGGKNRLAWMWCVCRRQKLNVLLQRLTTLNLSWLHMSLIIFQDAASTTESGKKSKKRDKKKGKTAKQKLHGFFFYSKQNWYIFSKFCVYFLD